MSGRVIMARYMKEPMNSRKRNHVLRSLSSLARSTNFDPATSGVLTALQPVMPKRHKMFWMYPDWERVYPSLVRWISVPTQNFAFSRSLMHRHSSSAGFLFVRFSSCPCRISGDCPRRLIWMYLYLCRYKRYGSAFMGVNPMSRNTLFNLIYHCVDQIDAVHKGELADFVVPTQLF